MTFEEAVIKNIMYARTQSIRGRAGSRKRWATIDTEERKRISREMHEAKRLKREARKGLSTVEE